MSVEATEGLEIPEGWTHCEVRNFFRDDSDIRSLLIISVGGIAFDLTKGELSFTKDGKVVGRNFPAILQIIQEQNPDAEFTFS